MAVRMRGARVPEEALRAARVTSAVSAVSALAVVREHLLELQRAAAPWGPGWWRRAATWAPWSSRTRWPRSTWTRTRVNAPGAASCNGAEPPNAAEVGKEAQRLEMRDKRDSTRVLAPLARAGDAVLLDTTDMDPRAQTEAVVRLVRSVEASR